MFNDGDNIYKQAENTSIVKKISNFFGGSKDSEVPVNINNDD